MQSWSESSGGRATRTQQRKNIGTLRFGEREKKRASSHLLPLLSLSKKNSTSLPTAKMARSSIFAFIGVCLAVVAAGSGSVSGELAER